MLTKVEKEFGDLPIKALNDPRVRRDFSIGAKRSPDGLARERLITGYQQSLR